MYHIYRINIYEKDSGKFIGYMEAFTLGEIARLIKNELEHENAVELIEMTSVGLATFWNINTDKDGFCHQIKG